jgi:Zn-finger nucleic acid-binding protein
MHCHNCGFLLESDGVDPIAVCDICRTYRSVEVPDDTGERIVSLGRPGEFRCPGCRRRLTQAGMDGLKVEHCAGCRGVLLTNEAFAMYLRNRRPEFREAARQPVVLIFESQRNDIHCPTCRRAMNVHPCYGPDYIIIDGCMNCGVVWLELQESRGNRRETTSGAGVPTR